MTAKPRFEPGRNIAMKVPAHRYEATLSFYRDTLSLPAIDQKGASGFQFGPMQLWIDRCPQLSQAEIWLEIVTDDTQAAAKHLEEAGIVRCDPIEELGTLDGYWVLSPADIVHLVDAKTGAW